MDDLEQCKVCGAVLAEDDLFCGECGTLRSPVAEVPETAEESPVPEPSAPPEAPSSVSPVARWRAAFIVLIVLGIVGCILALVAFLVVGASPSEATTPQEDWILSALCCLLPIGGAGAFLITMGALIWYRFLKER